MRMVGIFIFVKNIHSWLRTKSIKINDIHFILIALCLVHSFMFNSVYLKTEFVYLFYIFHLNFFNCTKLIFIRPITYIRHNAFSTFRFTCNTTVTPM